MGRRGLEKAWEQTAKMLDKKIQFKFIANKALQPEEAQNCHTLTFHPSSFEKSFSENL